MFWRKPWSGGGPNRFPINMLTKKPYRGVNPLILWLAADEMEYQSHFWGTLKQWEPLGGEIVGDPTMIVFSLPNIYEDPDTGKKRKVWLLREYYVYNADQVVAPSAEKLAKKSLSDLHKLAKKIGAVIAATRLKISQNICDKIKSNLAPFHVVAKPKKISRHERFEATENFITNTGAKIIYRGDRACYRPATDTILVPKIETFDSSANYYETIFHELVHWTEHKDRLDWKRRIGDRDNYSLGELIAELGSAFLAAEMGLTLNKRMLENHAAYLQFWIEALKEEPKFLFVASNQANKASDYLLSLGGEVPEVT